MREIGRVKLVQVQRSSLKAGQRPHRYYDPAPLLEVDSLLLSPGGAIGIAAGGERTIDIHHAEHPQSKNHERLNDVSIGFTSHYRAMRERFGPHLTDGCAGENILVESEQAFTLNDLGEHLAIEATDGRLAVLARIMVAAPCVEFSQFAAGPGERLPAEVIKSTLQFLDRGMRGFYAGLMADTNEATVRAGDRVFSLTGQEVQHYLAPR
jgi:hypothetical protein